MAVTVSSSAAIAADPSLRFVLPDDSPLVANLGALWAVDAALARQVEAVLDEKAYPVEPSKAGPATLSLTLPDGKRIYLHSRHQPVEEAKRLIETPELAEKSVFCVQGLGLGYHVEQLFECAGDEALVVVFEPDVRMIRTAFEQRDFSKIILTNRLALLTEADRAIVTARLGSRQALFYTGSASVVHAPSVRLHPAFFAHVQTVLAEFAAYCRTSLNTLVLNGRRTCENVAMNLGWYVATPGIDSLKNRHAKQPAVIVSAGPSLRKNKHLLKGLEGRAVMVAVQTTLQPLVEMGVEPDYVTSLDYHDICTRFFEKLPPTLRTTLVAEPKASSAIFSMFPGAVRLLGNEFADKLLGERTAGKERLRAGATVAHLAFYLAEYMGCDPIIFVGQDLGFSDGLCYAPGTSYEHVWRPELSRFCTMEMKQWEHVARERPILRRIEDHQGRAMYTEERLFAYLQQFERDFATSPSRIIDATEGGALKRGATVMTFGDALEQFCPAGTVGAGERGNEAAAMEWGRVSEAVRSLDVRSAEAEQIGAIAKETLPLLEEVREHLEDQGRVNRLIARIDVLRSRMFQLNDCYELVTQLNQRMEFQRFQSDRQTAAAKATGIDLQRRQLARDIANVRAVMEAAGEFTRLMTNVIERLGVTMAERKRAA
jgi:hypothetical protein